MQMGPQNPVRQGSPPVRKYLQTLNKVQGEHLQESGESAEENHLSVGGDMAVYWRPPNSAGRRQQGETRDAPLIAALNSSSIRFLAPRWELRFFPWHASCGPKHKPSVATHCGCGLSCGEATDEKKEKSEWACAGHWRCRLPGRASALERLRSRGAGQPDNGRHEEHGFIAWK